MWIIKFLPYIFKLLDYVFKFLDKRLQIKRNRIKDIEEEKKQIIEDEKSLERNTRMKDINDGLNWWVNEYSKSKLEAEKSEAMSKGKTAKVKKLEKQIEGLQKAFDEGK